MFLFNDISEYQGAYNVQDGNPLIMMKMSGGDAGLYYDKCAAVNYQNTIKAGKIPFMYHFYGGGDPTVEADFFLKAVSPLAPGDGLAVDIERGATWNPQTDPSAVAKVQQFVEHIHAATGVWCWVYMNISTANMYDWSPVFDHCGFWCAAPSYGWDDTLPVKYTVIAQQGPIVGGHDTDACFATLDQARAYTYQPPSQPAPAPAAEAAAPLPAAAPVAEPLPQPVPQTPPVAAVQQPVMAPADQPAVPAGPSPQEPLPAAPSPAPAPQHRAVNPTHEAFGAFVLAMASLGALFLAWLHSLK